MRRALWMTAGLLIFGAVLAAHFAWPQGFGALTSRPPPFVAEDAPPAPDYAKAESWAARPGAPSGADAVPDGLGGARDNQARAAADVFFIHPTTYLANAKWNAAFDEPGDPARRIDRGVLRNQASVFNGCCRIYAPRYRQATLAAFFNPSPDAEAALNLAYSDVLRAFDYYIAHDNGGRPFIIAAHSQGANHAMRLLQERIAGTALAQRMVAAYVIGANMPVDIEAKGLPICREALQTGCVVGWNSVAAGRGAARRKGGLMWFDGRYQPSAGHQIVCVNPLNWRPDGAAPASENLGAVPGSLDSSPHLPAPEAGLTGAVCQSGVLEINIPLGRRRGFIDPLTLIGVYHDLDYNLYYMNIRKNAGVRVAAYLGR